VIDFPIPSLSVCVSFSVFPSGSVRVRWILGSLSGLSNLVIISVLGVSTAYSVFETLRLVTPGFSPDKN